jgi:hypothetical protein
MTGREADVLDDSTIWTRNEEAQIAGMILGIVASSALLYVCVKNYRDPRDDDSVELRVGPHRHANSPLRHNPPSGSQSTPGSHAVSYIRVEPPAELMPCPPPYSSRPPTRDGHDAHQQPSAHNQLPRPPPPAYVDPHRV